MRSRNFTLYLFFIALFPFKTALSQHHYYWYGQTKIPLTTDSATMFFQLKNADASAAYKQHLKHDFSIADAQLGTIGPSGVLLRSVSKQLSGRLAIDPARARYAAPILKYKGASLIVLPSIELELKDGHTISEVLQRFADRLSVKKDVGFNTFLLDVKESSFEKVLDIANGIHVSGLVNWCEPELYMDVRTSDDPLYPDQYYLHNTGQYGGVAGIDINVLGAWDITHGSSSIRVAVIDEGVEAHEELTGRLLSGYTVGGGTGAPQNGDKGHGEAVAGIIGAAHNDIGIKGVAPNVQILPVNIFPYTPDPANNPGGAASSADIAVAIDWAWNQGAADVLNCSWGSNSPSSAITAAINRARTNGRGGRGCPVIAASGNSATTVGDVASPANIDGVITVGACNNNPPAGEIWYYSQRGASMDLVAPSGDLGFAGDVMTIDRMGSNGYTFDNYMPFFGGTSAAAPQVSGIAALMLSVNPNLTEATVRQYLQNSATDMGAAGFDNTFGFGRANACGAVARALNGALWLNGNEEVCDASTYTVSLAGNALNTGTVTWSVTPAGVVSLAPNGNSATLTKLVDGGYVTLTASVNLCGTTVNVSRGMHVGLPSPIQSVEIGQNLCPNTNYIAWVVPSEYTRYEWYLPQGWYGNGPGGQTPFVTYDYQLDFFTGQWGGPADLTVFKVNGCGSVSYTVTSEGSCGGFFSVTPNPAVSEVWITSRAPSGGQPNAAARMSKLPQPKAAVVQRVNVFDMNGRLVRSTANKGDAAKVSVNVSGLPNGVYVVEIYSDGKVSQREKILVQH